MRRRDHDVRERLAAEGIESRDMQRVDGDIRPIAARRAGLLIDHDSQEGQVHGLIGLTSHRDRLAVDDQPGNLRAPARARLSGTVASRLCLRPQQIGLNGIARHS